MLKRILIFALISICALIIGELIYFFSTLTSSTPKGNTEAVVIFSGENDRISPGYAAAKKHNARYLIISPASDETIELFRKTYSVGSARYLPEKKAETTFENALYVSEIISNHRICSVILVTSSYHMPRSLFLLKLLLLGKDVRVQTLKTGGKGVTWGEWYRSGRGWKIVYNEMVQLWGSLGEMAFYKIWSRMPVGKCRRSAVVGTLKSWLLFDV